jgi:multimeric flavodoxin WrbA
MEEKKLKAMFFNGSPRKNKNTADMLKKTAAVLKKSAVVLIKTARVFQKSSSCTTLKAGFALQNS